MVLPTYELCWDVMPAGGSEARQSCTGPGLHCTSHVLCRPGDGERRAYGGGKLARRVNRMPTCELSKDRQSLLLWEGSVSVGASFQFTYFQLKTWGAKRRAVLIVSFSVGGYV